MDALRTSRLLILEQFIILCEEQNIPEPDRKILWLQLQLNPPYDRLGREIFTSMFHQQYGASALREELIPNVLKLGDLSLVFDESQTLNLSNDGKTEHSALSTILQWVHSNASHYIFSGTNMSSSTFESVRGSAYGKLNGYENLVETGVFNVESQQAYLKRYLPPSFLSSEQGQRLETIVRRWLVVRFVRPTLMPNES
jgi:hypothetical protein